ncbi:MAG: MBL fold metallo-hydrolase [Lachnospiraceae bacterium]|nr:MBL fold metallo-hydrolase [Lachnospiraceae bacterium]
MRSYNSYNGKGGKKGSYKRYRRRRKAPLWVSLLLLVFLLLMRNRQVSEWIDGLTDEVNQNAETVSGGEVIKTGDPEGELEVHFLDVGHGDSTVILCGEHVMMIDCGDDSQGTKLQNYLTKHGVKKLDYLVLTHPDKDHIGGAPVILTKFPIDQVFQSDYYKDNKTADKLRQTLEYARVDAITPQVGEEYQLGEAYFTILAPVGEYEESNNSSIALLLHFGDNTFLFTGDAEKEAENDMVENSTTSGLSLKADVYQAGHHGSKSSSKKKFLSAVSPEFAVISCDYQGDYGHPHAEVLNRLREAGIKVFRTDEQGTIVAVSDGKNITWNCAPSESWIAGEPGKSKDSK